MKINRFLWLLLLAVSSFAQTHTEVTVEDNQTVSGNKSFTGSNTFSGTLTGSGDNPLVWGGSGSFKRIFNFSSCDSAAFANTAACQTDAGTTGGLLFPPNYTIGSFTNSNSRPVLNLTTPAWRFFLAADDFGIVCDGVTNATTNLQNLLNSSLSATSHIPVMLPPGKTCVANVTLSTGESLIGPIAYQADYSGNMTTTLKSAVAGSAAVVTIASGATNVAVANLLLSGNGSGSLDRGVWAANSTRLYVENIGCNNFGEECVRWEAGIQLIARNIFAVNSLLNRTRSVHSGVIYMAGTDAYLFDSEITASVSREGHIISASGFVDAIVDVGTNNWVVNTVGEISDEGCYTTDTHGHFHANRFDLNYGHGCEGTPGGEFVGNDILSNSQDTTNTYDSLHFTGGTATVTGNDIDCAAVACPRYGIFDSTNSGTVYSQYVGNKIQNMVTASYNFAGSSPPSALFAGKTVTIGDGVTTPNVDQAGIINFAASTLQTITQFNNGVPGQVIHLVGSANVTIAHDGTHIITCSASNENLGGAARAYDFIAINATLFRETGCTPKNGSFAGTLNVTGTSTLAGVTATSLAVNGGVTLGANQLPVYEAGTATVDKIYTNTQALTTGAATHTLANSFTYTSSATFGCTCTDQTAAAACKAVPASATTVTLAGTGSDVLWLSCSGH